MIRILIVDDDKNILSSLRKGLLRAGFEEIFLSNEPAKALSLIKEKKIDILITDINMQEMNGVELAKKAAHLKKKIKIIIMTVEENLKINNKKLNDEIIAFLDKPLDLYSLIDLLHKSEKKMPLAS